MASTIIAPGDMSDDSDRRVTIEIIGGGDQGRIRVAKYTIKVPYSSLAQRMQSIHRSGGKITRITLSSSLTSILGKDAIATSEIIPAPQPTEPSSPLPQPQTTPVTPPQITAVNSQEYTFTEEW